MRSADASLLLFSFDLAKHVISCTIIMRNGGDVCDKRMEELVQEDVILLSLRWCRGEKGDDAKRCLPAWYDIFF